MAKVGGKFGVQFGAVAVLLLAVACAGSESGTVKQREPVDAGDQAAWISAAPAEVGLDADKLEAARAYGFRDEFYTQAIVVIRHGYLAAEWYAEDSGPELRGASWSVAKSITATLIGQAIADGLIASVDVTMGTFVPEWTDAARAPIKLKDVLAMSSGLDWIEDYEGVQGEEGTSDVAEMVIVPDALRVAIDQPVRDPAGEVWSYSSGDTMLLGRALRAATGKTAADLVQEKLAKPMHMDSLRWWRDAQGETYTFCCADATARDFAKFGQLYLQGGVWGGAQLVPSDWIVAASSPQASANPGYGYQWWLNHPETTSGNWPSLPQSTYFALGHNGQYIAIFPDLDMVVVRLGQYVQPDTTDWVAPNGLLAAGIYSDNMGPTGTRAPEGDWDEDEFFRHFVEAIVE